jgi:5-oxoprolinase (ATP-hydrolysing)
LTIYLAEQDVEKDTSQLAECIRMKLDEIHTQQFSFSLASEEVEIMRLRAKVIDDSPEISIKPIEVSDIKDPPKSAIVEKKNITFEGKTMEAVFWSRAAVSKQGYIVNGPAVITEMDSNTLILPGFHGEIDQMGNILIWPSEKSQHKSQMKAEHTAESAKIEVEGDPLIATLISSSLQSIRREMDTLMLRCAMSPAIREQQDEFNVISNPKGQMLVGQFGSFIPSFLESWKGTIEEGDVFM